ncbi:MAG: hypothetical protein AAGF24_08330 [Cyanobacteria bacterium P01_H01_bin.121]
MQKFWQQFQRLSVLRKLKSLSRSSPILMTWVGMLAALGFVTGAALSVLVSPGSGLRAYLPDTVTPIDPDVIMGHQGLADAPTGDREHITQTGTQTEMQAEGEASAAPVDAPLLVITTAERNTRRAVLAADTDQASTGSTGLTPASWLLLLAMGSLGTMLLSRQILSTSSATGGRSFRSRSAPVKPAVSRATPPAKPKFSRAQSGLVEATAGRQTVQSLNLASRSTPEPDLLAEVDYRQRQQLSDLLN